jgi:hypothetical protein
MRSKFTQTVLFLICIYSCLSCAFITSVADYTFRDGLPLIDQEILWPSADELSGLSEDEKMQLSGFPSTLNHSSFAHLSGALAAQGQCKQMAQKSSTDLTTGVKNIDFELVSCTADDRCSEDCIEVLTNSQGEEVSSKFEGMKVENFVNITILSAAQSKTLVGKLPEKNADGIVQVRLEFQELFFFQGEDKENVNDYIENFELSIAKGSDQIDDLSQSNRQAGLQYTRLIDAMDLPTIKSNQPQKFEIALNSEVGQYLIQNILGEKEVNLVLKLSFQIPQHHLYSMDVNPAGLKMKVQPEITINVIDVVSSQL